MLSVFGAYDFAVRDGLVLCLVALAVYVLLRAGIFAVPQVGLMAVGAYTSAILTSLPASGRLGGYELPLVVGWAASMVAAGLIAWPIGKICLRFRSDYLAIATIGIAEGALDVYPRFGPTSEWDTAASQILLEEAGGGLTDDRGAELAVVAEGVHGLLGHGVHHTVGDQIRDVERVGKVGVFGAGGGPQRTLDLGALGGQVFAHGAAQALAAAGDDDDFVFEFHNTTPQMV